MTPELIEKWKEYKEWVADEKRDMRQSIMDRFGPTNVSTSSYYTPTFEGFMDWLSLHTKSK